MQDFRLKNKVKSLISLQNKSMKLRKDVRILSLIHKTKINSILDLKSGWFIKIQTG